MDRIPRPEYPRPQLVRPRWRCLNGPWQLAFDASDRGLRDGWECGRPFEKRIQVPYPVGAPLSGVSAPEPPARVWYRRELDVRADELGPRTRLHVGACDFETHVFVNGRDVGRHRGGYTPVVCEAGHALHAGSNEIVLRVEDRDTWTQPRGKQAAGAFRTPVDYDPVVGVWQSVWLEPLPEVSIDEVWTRWSAAVGELAVHVAFSEPWSGEVEVALFDGESELARERGAGLGRPEARVPLRLSGPRLWSPSDPHLHALEVTLLADGREADRVTSPCGVREVGCDGGRVLLNGAPLYLRGVLDQGYFPGGWYAAASDGDLRRDVELVRSLGFNCARKHQKLEDPRWLHWADRLGLLVWSEMPSGRDFTTALVSDLAREWTEAVRRDRAHACIVAWVPFNESWGAWNQAGRPEERAFVEGVAGLTRALDPTRLVVANDGWEYAAGDLWTLHLYEGESEGVRERLAALLADPHAAVLPQGHLLGERVGALPGADVSGLPVLLTECGGIGFASVDTPAPGEPAFAYGALPKTEVELEARIRAAAEIVASCQELAGFVWTQLSDVQQEINGLVSFERRPKLPVERLAAIFRRIGASG